MDKEISQIILNAINEIAEEKQIAKEDIIEALKEGLKKHMNIKVIVMIVQISELKLIKIKVLLKF